VIRRYKFFQTLLLEKRLILKFGKNIYIGPIKTKVCKRKNAKKMPFAITSLKWLEYYEQQDKAKQEKEEAARLRKLKKEQKASTSQAEKNIIIKRKQERNDKNNTVRTKKTKMEKHFQAKELKKTSSKGERREDESSSSGSDDLTEVEEEQRNSTKNKSKNWTDKNLETKQILKIGDYVVVKYMISRARILGKMDYFYFLRHMYETCL
jgi:DNA mismatch repair ATPase MutL